MLQQSLIVESLEEALRDAVQALGGSKAVGLTLWPSKTSKAATDLCNHCLDVTRSENFDLSEVMLILRAARRKGCHTVMAYLAAQLDYECKPVDPESEVQRLQREFTASVDRLADIQRQLSAKTADVQAMRRVA